MSETNGFHDISTPYTEAELEHLRQICKKLPTYKPSSKDSGEVAVEELPAILEAIRLRRTPEQVKAYQSYWRKNFNGKIKIDAMVVIKRNAHKGNALAISFARMCDKNQDGFTSKDEFEQILEVMVVHDPAYAGFVMSFEDFMKEADLNKDGKISIDECEQWLEKKTRSK